MREIKFRAWDKINKKWHEFSHINFVIENPKEILNLKSIDESCELEQFTGLRDRNGVDIYEGDIVKFTYWWFDGKECESILTGEIIYSGENMSFQLKGVKNKEWERFTGFENNTEYLTPFSELAFDEADFQIIGNIHESPELKGER